MEWLNDPGTDLSEALSETTVALPFLFVGMIIPSLVIIAILWKVRVPSTWTFRAITFVSLLLPCVLSEDLKQFMIKSGFQASFALLMIRSRLAEKHFAGEDEPLSR